jgi:hypothetical protein
MALNRTKSPFLRKCLLKAERTLTFLLRLLRFWHTAPDRSARSGCAPSLLATRQPTPTADEACGRAAISSGAACRGIASAKRSRRARLWP